MSRRDAELLRNDLDARLGRLEHPRARRARRADADSNAARAATARDRRSSVTGNAARRDEVGRDVSACGPPQIVEADDLIRQLVRRTPNNDGDQPGLSSISVSARTRSRA